LGFKKRTGQPISNDPAIIVFVPEKINPKWIPESEIIPSKLEGPGGLWCPIDVVAGGRGTSEEEIPQGEDKLCEDLRGAADQIWVGSQISCWTGILDPFLGTDYSIGTIGAFARSLDDRGLGILTNAHVGMNPGTQLYHPVPWGTPLAMTEKVSLYDKDQEWYGSITDEKGAWVRTDCAFARLTKNIDLSDLNPQMMGVGDLGNIKEITLNDMFPVGQKVLRVGRTTGRRSGMIVAFGYEFIDERNVKVYTDLLIVGENETPFSTHGDSGSLILLDNELRQPIGLLWGGRQEKLRSGYAQEKWTWGTCLDRILKVLNIKLITDPVEFQEA
jgi:hypothetical protein